MPRELCNFDLTHDLDIDFFKVRFQIVVYHELLVKLMQSKKEVNQLDTGLTALLCPITTPMILTFKFQIKVCNNLISIILGPIDMAQASYYLFPVLLFAGRFHSKLPVIKLKIKNTLNCLYTYKNILW